MGLLADLRGRPSPGVLVNLSNNCLCSWINVDVPHLHELRAPPKLGERFDLSRIGPEKLGRKIPIKRHHLGVVREL
jgi:hypothetical protein